MAKTLIASTGTQILDGTQTTNTLVSIGSIALRMATGTVGVRTYDDMLPIAGGQRIIIPPSVRVTFFCTASETSAYVWFEAFGA